MDFSSIVAPYFKLTTSGTLLYTYNFPCGAGGAYPVGPLMQAADGNFYGTTQMGGNLNYGTIYKMDQNGVVSIVCSLPAAGPYPQAGLVQATDGNLYSGTWGTAGVASTLFQVTTSGTYTLLYTFTAKTGQSVGAGLLQHTNGLLYGTTANGGQYGYGTLFSLDMGLGPFVALVRYRGKVGSTVQILGQGFTGTTSVTFNGVPAINFTIGSDTFLTAVVPIGATTGPVVATTPSGTLTSNRNFQIVH